MDPSHHVPAVSFASIRNPVAQQPQQPDHDPQQQQQQHHPQQQPMHSPYPHNPVWLPAPYAPTQTPYYPPHHGLYSPDASYALHPQPSYAPGLYPTSPASPTGYAPAAYYWSIPPAPADTHGHSHPHPHTLYPQPQPADHPASPAASLTPTSAPPLAPPIVIQPPQAHHPHHSQHPNQHSRPRVRTTGTPPRTGHPLTPPLTPATANTANNALTSGSGLGSGGPGSTLSDSDASTSAGSAPVTTPPQHLRAPHVNIVSTPSSSASPGPGPGSGGFGMGGGGGGRPPRMMTGVDASHSSLRVQQGSPPDANFAPYAYGYPTGYQYNASSPTWQNGGNDSLTTNATVNGTSERRERKPRRHHGSASAARPERPLPQHHSQARATSNIPFPSPISASASHNTAPYGMDVLPHVSESDIARVLQGGTENGGPSSGHFLLISGIPKNIDPSTLKASLTTIGDKYRGIFTRFLPSHGFVVVPFFDARHCADATKRATTNALVFARDMSGDGEGDGEEYSEQEDVRVRVLSDEDVNILLGPTYPIVLETNARLLIHLDASASSPSPSPNSESFANGTAAVGTAPPSPAVSTSGVEFNGANEGGRAGPLDLMKLLSAFGEVRAVEGVPGSSSVFIAEYFDARNVPHALSNFQNRTVRGVRLRISPYEPSASSADADDSSSNKVDSPNNNTNLSTTPTTPTSATPPTRPPALRRLSTGSAGSAHAGVGAGTTGGAPSPTLTHSASEQDLRKKAQAQQVQAQTMTPASSQEEGVNWNQSVEEEAGGAYFSPTSSSSSAPTSYVRSTSVIASSSSSSTTPRLGPPHASYWLSTAPNGAGGSECAYFIENCPAGPTPPQYNLHVVPPSTRRGAADLSSNAGTRGGLNVHAPPHVPFQLHTNTSNGAAESNGGGGLSASSTSMSAYSHASISAASSSPLRSPRRPNIHLTSSSSPTSSGFSPTSPTYHPLPHSPTSHSLARSDGSSPFRSSHPRDAASESAHAQQQQSRTSGYRGLRTGVHSGLSTRQVTEHNLLNLEAIESGRDMRTTVMIKNIPNKMSARELEEYIAGVEPRRIDFLYLRMDFQNGCNVGYAFVNFINVQDLFKFASSRLGVKWNMFSSEKVLQMSYANYQGKEALVEKFKNSCIMDEREAWRPRIFYSDGANTGLAEPFPPPTHLRRKERSLQNRGQLFVPTHGHGHGHGPPPGCVNGAGGNRSPHSPNVSLEHEGM